ncbi:Sensory box histidine kinase [Labilithrix luteola]|uniref:histidine kinase n=1 Tax=Labilithrix luteola TaxID=1391654 RepID=A0A0K1Q4V5_9BACT|nr:GAF domain-containing sensor histidine kinase [Labilithrix luteola]AKV00435.1 Sensory box histidine kinase [Labilithrix luteola]
MAAESVPDASARALETLESLLEIPAANLETALSNACDLTANALGADKVDVFLYDASRASLVALGTSSQPLSLRERKAGLDVLPIANGGHVPQIFETGKRLWTGHLETHTDELVGIRETLAIRSQLGVPLDVGGVRRGVLMIASLKPELFTKNDVRFAESIARWIGLVAHRAELVEAIGKNAAEQGRRAAAEELLTVLAHDLRNYLSPIVMRLNLVGRRSAQEHRDDDTHDVERALKALDRLGNLISSLLDVARIDEGLFEIAPQPIDLRALVQDAVQVLSTPQRPIALHACEELLAYADETRLRQCIDNLLSNALKHSPCDAPVTVNVSKQAHEGGSWGRIDVVDEGPGIPTSSCRASSNDSSAATRVGEALAWVCISRRASPRHTAGSSWWNLRRARVPASSSSSRARIGPLDVEVHCRSDKQTAV